MAANRAVEVLTSARAAVFLALLAGASLAAMVVSPGADAEPPPGFEIRTEMDGLRRPTSFKFSPDGRVFVAEHRGVIQVFDSLSDSSPTEVIDIRDQVHAVDGRGLLAIELDPNFPTDPYLYMLYTYDGVIGGPPSLYSEPGGNEDECPTPPGPGSCVAAGRLSRLTISGDVATDETVLIEDWCQTDIHSVGDLAWGPSGELFVSHGDGAFGGQPDYGQRQDNLCGDAPGPVGAPLSLPDAEGGAVRAQDYQTSADPLHLNGSIIRVDPDTGEGWHDNATASSGNANERRLIGYGLRNPFRLEVRPGTAEVWSGDVGWNTHEELNVITDPTAAPANHGWPCFEGPDRAYDIGLTLCENLFADPSSVQHAFWSYRQNESIGPLDTCRNTSGAITGLQFYEGGAYPAAYDGALFMADSSRECVWVMPAGADGLPIPGAAETLLTGENIIDIELGPGGDVYLLSLLGGGAGAKIFRVAHPAGDPRPTARLTADTVTGPTDLTVSFQAGLSSPAVPGDTLTFAWDLDGDGQYDDGTNVETASFTYAAEGRYVARVRVTDQRGQTDTASVTILAGTPPQVSIQLPQPNRRWAVGDIIDYSGSATDDGAALPPSALSWDVILHHCETINDCHIHIEGTSSGSASGSFEAPEHEYPAFVELVLTATDAAGLTSSTSVELLPETTQLTATTDPVGLEAILNDHRAATPLTREVIVGSRNTLTAPLGQAGPGDSRFDFVGWGDGGAASHDIVVGTSPETYTASYALSERPSVNVSDAYIAEVNKNTATAEFRLSLSYPSTKRVTVKVDTADGTATRQDYFGIGTPKTVVFPAGVTERTFGVKIKNDPIDEPTQTFYLDVVSATNATIGDGRGVGHIADNDAPPRLAIADVAVSEGDAAQKVAKVRLGISSESQHPARATVTVVGGTAVPGVDYGTIPATALEWDGTRRLDLPITIYGNDEPDPPRTIELRFSDTENIDLVDDTFVVTITDDEPGITGVKAKVTEGASGTRTMRVQLKLAPVSNRQVTVEVATADGTATAGEDYRALTKTVVFNPRQRTATVNVVVLGDQVPEPDETFELMLTDPSGASLRTPAVPLTIVSDDFVPEITVDDAEVSEDGRNMVFTARLSGPSSKLVKARYRTIDGSAIAPEDYGRKLGRRIQFRRGKTEVTFKVAIKNDSLTEPDETFQIELYDPVAGIIGDPLATGTILDDD